MRQKFVSALQVVVVPLVAHWLYTSTLPLMRTSPGSAPRPATSV
ncbi:MAG: hypothetical protein ACRCYR_05855 [Phycicoccus sp.]